MTTILAPVDFSLASANALAFAAELCNRASARLVLVHVLQRSADKDEANSKLATIESDLHKSFGADLKCDVIIAEGNLIDALKKTIAIQLPDLIIMGTKGASGLKELLIGSNTVNVISKIRMPVLVVPEAARFQDFVNAERNKIVLATDLDSLENESILGILKKIALIIIAPKVRVLSVRPKHTTLPDYKKTERNFLLSVFSPEIESERITVFSNNVIDGINYYLDQNRDTGLVAMIARDTGQLIQKHYTREMASHTHLPLLVLSDVKP